MKYLSRILLIFLIFILSSCGSKVPIADVSQAIQDDKIIGKWTTVERDMDERIDISVFKFKGKEYMAWVVEEKRDSSKTEIRNKFYRVYSIDISGKKFINAQDINSPKEDNRLYFFYNYEFLTDSTLFLVNLKDVDSTKIDKFEKSEDLYNFIKTNINNKKLYGDSTEMIKVY